MKQFQKLDLNNFFQSSCLSFHPSVRLPVHGYVTLLFSSNIYSHILLNDTNKGWLVCAL